MLFRKMNYRLCEIYMGAPKHHKPDMSKDWYVYYFYNKNFDDPYKKPEFVRQPKIMKGINKHKTLRERKEAAKEVAAEMNAMLEAGFNPYKSIEENIRVMQSKQQPQSTFSPLPVYMYPQPEKLPYMALKEAIDWALESKRQNNIKWRDGQGNLKTPSGYRGIIDYFLECCSKRGYISMSVSEISVIRAREIIQDMVNGRNLGDHAYLKFKGTMYTVFQELKDWGKIVENPFNYKSNKRKPKPREKAEFTNEERAIVRQAITSTNERWYTFLMIMFHTHIRPVEIFRLKIEHINIEKREIFLPAEVTKTDSDRYAIITAALVPYLEKLHLDKYDPKMYLFGHDLEPEYRMPNVKKDRAVKLRDRWTKMWEQVVKKGLGINKNMYWLKDEGINSKADAGLDIQSIRLQTGHTSTAHTDAYLSRNPRRSKTKDKLSGLNIDWIE